MPLLGDVAIHPLFEVNYALVRTGLFVGQRHTGFQEMAQGKALCDDDCCLEDFYARCCRRREKASLDGGDWIR